jgi:nucleoside-diphosphate-sugar epimerase
MITEDPTLRSVLVTGATGFLGGAVARWLNARGWSVTGTGRRTEMAARLLESGIRFVACDLSLKGGGLEGLLDQLGPGGRIVHCAALSSPWGRRSGFVASNVLATQRLVELALVRKIPHFVHISTPAVSFSYEIQRNLPESTPWPAAPANHYIETKRLAELAVNQAAAQGLPATILRPKALFGPGDTTLLPRLIKVAAKGRFPLFGADVELDLTWIGDACRAVELALNAPPRGRCYHVTSGCPMSRNLILKTLFDACGLNVRFRPMGRGFALGMGSALEWISKLGTLGHWEPPLTRYGAGTLAFGQTLDITAARRDLGYAPQTDLPARLIQCGNLYRSKI